MFETRSVLRKILKISHLGVVLAALALHACRSEIDIQPTVPPDGSLAAPTGATAMEECTFSSVPPAYIDHLDRSVREYDRLFLTSGEEPICVGRQKGKGLRIFFFESRRPTHIIHLRPQAQKWSVSYSKIFDQQFLLMGLTVLSENTRFNRRVTELILEIHPWCRENTYEFFLDGHAFVVEVYEDDAYHRYYYRKYRHDRHMLAIRELHLLVMEILNDPGLSGGTRT